MSSHDQPTTEDMRTTGESITYFAYGSNLSRKRLHVNCPGAKLSGVGKLDGYQLDFLGRPSERWKGSVASIVPRENTTTWGAVWRIRKDHVESLDRQEWVHLGVYKRVELTVELTSGEKVVCITYEQNDTTPGLPSPQYLNVIIEGAKEIELPHDYIKILQSLPHNGYSVDDVDYTKTEY